MKKLGIGTYSLSGGFGKPVRPLEEQLMLAREMGYTGIEFLEHDLRNHEPQELKDLCAKAGLEPISMHCSVATLRDVMPVASEIGLKMLITAEMDFTDRSSAIAFAKKLSEIGREAYLQYGLKLGYHNHTGEFWMDDHRYLEDYLMEHSSAEALGFQLDAGWCAAAGVDPVEYVRNHPGRFISIHVKECNRAIGPEEPKPPETADPPFEVGPDGMPVLDESARIMMEAIMKQMQERNSIQCPMGDPTSLIDWPALKKLTDAQNNDCQWIVEREYDYKNGDMTGCLAEDAAWLLNHVG